MRCGVFGVTFSNEVEPAQPPAAAHKRIPARTRRVTRKVYRNRYAGRSATTPCGTITGEAAMPVHIVEYADYL